MTNSQISLHDWIISWIHVVLGIDVDWIRWLWWPLMTVTVILPTVIYVLFYLCACIFHIYRFRQSFRLNELVELNMDFKLKIFKVIALIWDCHGWIWHGYEIVGFKNIPTDSGAILVYYHGCLPVDYYYLISRYVLVNRKIMHTITARFLFKIPGLKGMMETLGGTPGTVQQIAELVKNGNVVTVAPGGVREALFSENYELLWNDRMGFAKAACAGQVPIIPVFTQNIKEAYKTSPFFRGTFRWLFEKTSLPLMPIYGGFPVKLRTFVGKPIPYDPEASPRQMADRTADALRKMIKEHQQQPSSIVSALLARLR